MEGFTIKELEKIISDGDFNSLIGKIENEFFDCKTGRYNLGQDLGKFELAKDVTSFANINGGYILIGPQTKESKTHFGDEIISISLYEQNLVDTRQYLSIISAWVYPGIEGLDIKWWPDKNEVNKGIVIIKIPPQKETSGPFLMKVLIDGRKIREIIFGYASRKGDKVSSKEIKEIYTIMKDGLLYDEIIKSRLDYLETKINEVYDRIREPGLLTFGLHTKTLSEEIEQIIDKKLGRRDDTLNNFDYKPFDYGPNEPNF